MRVCLSVDAQKDIRELDRVTAKRIDVYLRNIERLPFPTMRGKALTGDWAGHWRYRVGDYRIVCKILHEELIVMVVKIAHRSKVYRK